MKFVVPVAAAILLLCVGCDPTPVGGAPTATATETSTPTPTPTPTVASTKPALSDLVLSPEGILTPAGIAPLIIGQAPPATDPALDILIYRADACEWALAEYPDFTPVGMWVPNYDVDTTANDPGPFGVIVDDGSVYIIGVYSEELETAVGAHLHMTQDELLAAYPTGLELTHGDGLDVYRLSGTAGDLIFTLWEGDAGVFQVGQIVITQPGFEVPLGGSDFGFFGACFGA